jgi:hypothetical protein
MRTALACCLIFAVTPALAQFPPPGIYACTDADGTALGSLSLLVAGDYQWQTPDGASATGQVASASTSVTALSGPLAGQHWSGDFSTESGTTTFVFKTDAGPVACK